MAPWQLQPTGPIPFDRKLSGWWLIDVPPWNDARMPDPAGRGPLRRWVTTPTAVLLQELADQGLSGGFDVLDSYTGRGRRLFRGFAEMIESGYQATKLTDPPVASALKMAGAREVIGLMNTGAAKFSTHRPDWHGAVIGLARANLWRKLHRVGLQEGRWPYAPPLVEWDTGRNGQPRRLATVDTDNVWYGSDNADPIAAAPRSFVLGDRLGQFKHKGSR